MSNEKKIYKSFEKWAEDYDMTEMSGIGSGCSYQFLLGMKPAWEARQNEIDELKKEIKVKDDFLNSMSIVECSEGNFKNCFGVDVRNFLNKWSEK